MATRKKSTSKKKSASKKPVSAPVRKGRDGLELPSRIYAQASAHSVGGLSMFDAASGINAGNVGNFLSEDKLLDSAVARLQQAGFEVLQISGSMINICGSPKTYENAFGAPIVVYQQEVIKENARQDMAEFLDCHNTELPGLIGTRGTAFADVLEGVAIEEPRYYMAASALPPNHAYWHLNVPADVSLGCNADIAHRGGITGRGIVVSMVDSGFFRHPFFTARGYRADDAVLGPGATSPGDDESGHGTGESANIFALAPDVRLRPVKMSFVNSIGAFDVATGFDPDIITCSWGSSIPNGPLSAANVALGNAVATAVASGIVVVFSAGNGHFGFPGQHPDVISAGGVFMREDGSLTASNYSSGFLSNIYPGRRVPDLSGLVGESPGARYIMLPVQPGDSIDAGGAGGTHPNGDETADDDGWASFSGTSAAAPQLAGAAALVKQACSALTPEQIRDVLKTTAKDVTTGSTAPSTGNTAGPGPDLATGHGLVDAHRATLLARLRCRGGPLPPIMTVQPPIRPPITPIQPPIEPIRPPIIPIQPPITPIRPPITPIQPPIEPIRPPIQPIRPIRPIQPVRPIGPVIESRPQGDNDTSAGTPEASLDEGDLDALEQMVRDGMIDPGEI